MANLLVTLRPTATIKCEHGRSDLSLPAHTHIDSADTLRLSAELNSYIYLTSTEGEKEGFSGVWISEFLFDTFGGFSELKNLTRATLYMTCSHTSSTDTNMVNRCEIKLGNKQYNVPITCNGEVETIEVDLLDLELVDESTFILDRGISPINFTLITTLFSQASSSSIKRGETATYDNIYIELEGEQRYPRAYQRESNVWQPISDVVHHINGYPKRLYYSIFGTDITSNHVLRSTEIWKEGKYTYKRTSDTTCAICNCKDATSSEIIIPKVTQTKALNVTAIYSKAFSECGNLTRVKLPDTLQELASDAFEGCRNLKYTGGEYLPSSNNEYFALVKPNSNTVSINDNTVIIGEKAFYEHTTLTSITIPGSVTYINKSAFEGCSNLTQVIYNGSNSDRIYYERCFARCTGFDELTITACKTLMNCLQGCTSLRSLSIPFSGTLIDGQNTESIAYLFDDIIPENLHHIELTNTNLFSIKDRTFEELTSIQSITLVECIRKFGEKAFAGCVNLHTINWPESLEEIGNSAFRYCTALPYLNLTKLNLPAGGSIQHIRDYAFYGCTELSWVDIPNTLVSLGNAVFENCIKLRSVVIPFLTEYQDSIKKDVFTKMISQEIISSRYSIEYEEFAGTYERIFGTSNAVQTLQLTNTAILPHGFIQQASAAVSLKEVWITGNIQCIGSYAFKDCAALERVQIVNTLEWIGEDVFAGCPTSIFNQDSNCYYIGSSANKFYICVGIIDDAATSGKELKLNTSCELLPIGVFKNTSFKTINLPAGLKYIGDGAFEFNESLTTINSSSDIFKVYSGVLGQKALFKYESGKPVHLLQYLPTNSAISFTLPFTSSIPGTIGRSAFAYSQLTSTPSFIYVTDLGPYAFAYSAKLKDISIQNGNITYIPPHCFNSCTAALRVTLNSITHIEEYAFANCTSVSNTLLNLFNLCPTIIYIGDYAFYNCSKLTGFTNATRTPQPFEHVGAGAWEKCSSLEVIPFGIKCWKNITEIPERCFCGCSSLLQTCLDELFTELTELTHIRDKAFISCSSLTHIHLPDADDTHRGITYIGSYAFANCSKVVSITIPTTLKYLYSHAFFGLNNLETIKYTATSLSNTLDSNSAIFSTSNKIGDYYNRGKALTVNISNNVTEIPAYLFHGGTDYLKNVSDYPINITKLIFQSLDSNCECKTIGSYSFYKACSWMSTLELPDNITTIDSYAFFNTFRLKYLVIGSKISYVERGAFYRDESHGLNAYFAGYYYTRVYIGKPKYAPLLPDPDYDDEVWPGFTVGDATVNELGYQGIHGVAKNDIWEQMQLFVPEKAFGSYMDEITGGWYDFTTSREFPFLPAADGKQEINILNERPTPSSNPAWFNDTLLPTS